MTRKKSSLNLALIRKWHWMSASLCFMCMLLFSVTGITLHHAKDWLPKPQVTRISGELPSTLLAEQPLLPMQNSLKLPKPLLDWFAQQQIHLTPKPLELKDGKWQLMLSRPGETTSLNLDLGGNSFVYEHNDRGWIGYLNDLHKGKGTGKAWIYLMDIFALGCVVFSISGFLLLLRYADTRAQTWPLVLLGAFVPMAFIAFLVH